ncbi:MAG TPA: Holliday junction resolvase RuvX [Solirubrobacteraceae bacterium]|jgi:putative Holliday junction resolvase
MRVLGLDYGSARCGCALSDPTGTIVTPIDIIPRPLTKRGMAALTTLIATREVERVVVGLPLSLRGEDTMQTSETREFVRRLSRELKSAQPDPADQGVPVEMHDERFTTRMAQRMEGATTAEDSRAAAHMLEGWLAARHRAQHSASSR